MRKHGIKNLVVSWIVCGLLIVSIVLGGSLAASPAYADSSGASPYESQNVIDDLESSTIAGKEFSLEDYPYDENGQPQVINFVEFAYSFYTAE
ncbi:MAG: hypothetical protein LUI60_08070 [Clostridia bacterium]|nr:hypothetical protein [Clostridia bacterium]